MNTVTAIVNGTVITPVKEIPDGLVLIEGDRIKRLVGTQIEVPPEAEVIDVKGAYISPGFIDLHLHGAWGE